MSAYESPEQIVHSRMVSASGVLEHRVDLRGYPHRYLAVMSDRGIGVQKVTHAIAAAELLAMQGWRLMDISEFTSSRIVLAFLQRG
ncbi:transcriptional regulator [Micromonospora sp. H61]|uniref:transcriptional regulator n=1 Tax=Micromonospora sp. H61 TaxID=2824888 RepID=UPI001B3852AB|nr:transcriptional regulator [Micromonospora sp. H61]MBQ0992156.1 transcriptional regulator [Micromonospora sp. H61]